jgi:hypothetical protein
MNLKPEWVSMIVNGPVREGTSAPRPDVANPEYQSYAEEFVRVLVGTGCDGLFLAARPVTGFAGEFSSDSFRVFSLSFGLSLSPEQVFAINQSPEARAQERAATYWRWVGWKARSYAKLVGRLRRVLRELNPTATLLVEVHQVTLSAPLQGLEQYGEDLAELVPRAGGSVVVQREGAGGGALLEKLGQQLGTLDRLWVGVSVKVDAVPPSMGGLKQLLSDLAESSRLNVVILTESALTVP